MPSKHKTELLGWRNPPPELSAWLRAVKQTTGESISSLLTEAVTDLRKKRGQATGRPR